MGGIGFCFCCHRNRQVIVSVLFLLVSSFTFVRPMVAGRSLTKLTDNPRAGAEEEKSLVRTRTIGSRPPRCDKRCGSCGQCEAVQVPVTTEAQKHTSLHFSDVISSIAYSRGDGISNYKPMSWKCKCGNLIFNP
ncbi:hypothetical protein K2173_026559 [Erythroxylum novogranatense]|uniref:Epidermal patterning factor-like protein n=1 Tax=Erythroxylum novogranatense TaxID=1862640 RepID=A0AAV8TWF9_9ROSI|nr:hypothetical protein K2173_026559 [Erythroxylum novogranatense]